MSDESPPIDEREIEGAAQPAARPEEEDQAEALRQARQRELEAERKKAERLSNLRLARQKKEMDEKLRVAEEARVKAEEEAGEAIKVAEEARQKAEEEAGRWAEEVAQLKAEVAQREAEEEVVHGDGAPRIDGVEPLLGPVGQWVYIDGSNFVDDTAVTVGGQACEVHVYNPSSLGCRIPAIEGTHSIMVETPHGQAHSSHLYTVGCPSGRPTIMRLEQVPKDGEWMYIQGGNFVGDETEVALVKQAAANGDDGLSLVEIEEKKKAGTWCECMCITAGNVHVYSPSNLGFEVPSGAAEATAIAVTTPHGGRYVERAPLSLNVAFDVADASMPETIAHVRSMVLLRWQWQCCRCLVHRGDAHPECSLTALVINLSEMMLFERIISEAYSW